MKITANNQFQRNSLLQRKILNNIKNCSQTDNNKNILPKTL